MQGDESARVKLTVAESMIEHLVASGGKLATPGDPVAKVRREVLRGLRKPPRG